MIPGLWSLFNRDVEFPEHWFTAQICIAVAVAALLINITFESVYISSHLEDLEKKVIPGPRAKLLLGNFKFIRRCFNTHQLSTAFKKVTETFGTVFVVRWPLSTWVVLNDRESIAAVQVAALSEGRVELTNRYGLVFSVWGFSWGKAKKADGKWVASAAAKFGDRLRHFVDAAGKLTVRRCDRLLEFFADPREASRVDISLVVQRCALDAVCESALGVDLGEAFQDDMLLLLDECHRRCADLFPFQRYHPQRIMQSAGILSRVQQRVKARMARIRNVPEVILKDSSDLLSMLMKAADEDLSGDASDERIIGELLHYVISAYDAVWVAAAWVLYELARNPGALAAVRAGMKGEVVPHHSAAIRQTVAESLRMHPVIGYVAYTGVRIVQVKDYYLPENVTYICNVAALASDADTYPDPEKFDTARFGAPESLDAALRGPWMPFAHSCASEFTRVAGLPLVCAVVAAFVRKYDVSGAEDRQHLQETTCRPFKGLPMTLAAAAK